MTDMNKEVPNPVYDFLNSENQRETDKNRVLGDVETVINGVTSSNFEEIRKRKRANFKKILIETIWGCPVQFSSLNFMHEQLAELICKKTIDESVVN